MTSQPDPVPGRPTIVPIGNARCWQTKARDRLAWWLFSKIAHPEVAWVVKLDYVSCRDAKETRWTFGEDGSVTEIQQGLGRDD